MGKKRLLKGLVYLMIWSSFAVTGFLILFSCLMVPTVLVTALVNIFMMVNWNEVMSITSKLSAVISLIGSSIFGFLVLKFGQKDIEVNFSKNFRFCEKYEE